MMKTSKTHSREELKTDYRTFLHRQRGLTEKTISQYCLFLDRFMNYKFSGGPEDLSKITSHDIAGFLQSLTQRSKPLRDNTLVTNMRSLFRFLFQTEKIDVNLAAGIPSVARKYGRRIPYHLTTDQVEELLESVRTYQRSLNPKRDYAMVLLMARLGLRSHEIITIQLDDIDWRNGEIVIRGKGGYRDKTPLLKEIGEAITDYIQHERKGTSRCLFVTNRSLHGHFTDAQVLNSILLKGIKRTNIPQPKQFTVINILRHSLATNLVQRGATLEEISNTLRHRSRNSTLLYARQDIDGLRTIALSWPLLEGGRS